MLCYAMFYAMSSGVDYDDDDDDVDVCACLLCVCVFSQIQHNYSVQPGSIHN